MAGIETECRVSDYSDGATIGNRRSIVVKNHWNHSDRVVLVVGDTEYVVIADDLRAAIANAVNSHR